MRSLVAAALLALAPAADDEVLRWSELPALPDPVGFAGPFAGVADGALIVAGGANFPGGRFWDGHEKVWHDGVFVLDAPDGTWSRAKATLPRPLAYGVSATYGEAVVCVGGGDAEAHYAEAFLLRRAAGDVEVVPLPPLPSPTAYACGAILDDVLYVAGGTLSPTSTETRSTFLALDLGEELGSTTWTLLESWDGPPRMLATAAVLDGSFFLIGGNDLEVGDGGGAERVFLTDSHRYTPGSGWTRIADLPVFVDAAPSPAIPLGPTHFAVLNGDDTEHFGRARELRDEHPGFAPRILAYHTVTDTWRELGEFPKDTGPDPGADPNAGLWPPVTTAVVEWEGRHVIPSGEVRPGVRTPRVVQAEVVAQTRAFAWLDYLVLAVYFAGLVAMGVWLGRRGGSTDDFFLGGQRIPWWAAGLSIFGTQLSAITFMAIPAKSYGGDWVFFVANMTIIAVAPLVVGVYLPFFRRLKVTSAYEYLEQRFDGRVRSLGSLAFLLFQLGRMGIVLYLPALALAAVTGIDIYLCILVMGVLATLYTVMGGIEAVIWTDVIQVFVLGGGALFALVLVGQGVDGGLTEVFRIGLDEGKLHWANLEWGAAGSALWVIAIGGAFNSVVVYTSDQTVVQRFLTTSDERAAARSIWTNAALTLPASVLFFGMGTALWVFFRAHPDLLSATGPNDEIFPWFIASQMPAGLAGLVIAGLFAAAMSSLDSSLNSMATAITTDFYAKMRPGSDDASRLKLARTLTFGLGAVGTAVAVYLAALGGRSMLDTYLETVGLFLGGLGGLFALGLFVPRANGPGALVGFATSALVLWLVGRSGAVNFMLYAGLGLLTCVAVGAIASRLFPGADRDSRGLTVGTLEPS